MVLPPSCATTWGLDAVAVETGEECISGSDVIVTATGSRDPVFDAAWLSPGAHINAIGATTPGRREIDEATVGRCDVVVVESVAQAKVECGELMLAEDRGTFQWSQAVEMRHLVLGLAGKRPSPEAITLFDGLGVAMEDTAAAGVVLRKATGAGHRDGAAHRGAVDRRTAGAVGGRGGRPFGGPSTGSGRTDALQGLSAVGVVDCRQAGTEGSL